MREHDSAREGGQPGRAMVAQARCSASKPSAQTDRLIGKPPSDPTPWDTEPAEMTGRTGRAPEPDLTRKGDPATTNA